MTKEQLEDLLAQSLKDLIIKTGQLRLKDPPKIVWIRAKDAIDLLWRENQKLHNLQQLSDSVRRFGFQEPAKFDEMLFRQSQPDTDTEPLGAIKSGNGRIEVVAWLEENWEDVRNDQEEMPRGLGVDQEGAWVLPVLIGTNAQSTSAAMEYAIDANNITLSGGDLDGYDMARMWGAGYFDLLASLDELPLTIEPTMLEALSDLYEDPPTLDELEEEHGEPDAKDGWPHIRVNVSPDTLGRWNEIMSQIDLPDDDSRVNHLLDSVDYAQLLSGDLGDGPDLAEE